MGENSVWWEGILERGKGTGKGKQRHSIRALSYCNSRSCRVADQGPGQVLGDG